MSEKELATATLTLFVVFACLGCLVLGDSVATRATCAQVIGVLNVAKQADAVAALKLSGMCRANGD